MFGANLQTCLTAPLRILSGSLFRLSLLSLIALSTIACASAPAELGTRARFSPAFQGYVMAAANGSDDPGPDERVLVLRDPLTGNKLRCREQVLEWRELHEDLAADHVHDRNVAVAVAVTTGAVFAPLLAVQPVGGLVLAEALLAGGQLYDKLSSDDATELLAHGIALYNRKRYPKAAQIIERALAKDSAVGTLDVAYLYLGLSYDQQGNKARARLALSTFVDRAAVRDVDAYRNAESTLKTLGVKRARCASTEPVELHW
jgi:tetratricopeptide (TPR) repeat protein